MVYIFIPGYPNNEELDSRVGEKANADAAVLADVWSTEEAVQEQETTEENVEQSTE